MISRQSHPVFVAASSAPSPVVVGSGAPESPALELPDWVLGAFRGVAEQRRRVPLLKATGDVTVSARSAPGLSLVSVVVPRADELGAGELQRATADGYGLIWRVLSGMSARHVVRMWNFLPGISDRLSERLDRYMAFNLGRFEGMLACLGNESSFARHLPTATGVGHSGHDLIIHAFALARPGRPVDNPRQRPAFRYSDRFGPRPPCFTRAVAADIDGSTRLLIGGTASVLGEDSVHPGSLERQLEESIQNIAALIGTAAEGPAPLDRIVEARVYCADGVDADRVRGELARRFARAARIEPVRADLCRRELLVEIEAVAELSSPACNGNGCHGGGSA